MNTEKNKKIDEILDSLDHCERASAPDFFYTRLKARMQGELESKSRVKKAPLILRPVFALTAVVAVIVINAFVIFQNDNSNENTALSEAESIQSIAADYSLNDNTILFDINQEK